MRQFVCSGVQNVSCPAPVGLHLNSFRLSLAKFPLRLVFSQMVSFHLMWSIILSLCPGTIASRTSRTLFNLLYRRTGAKLFGLV